MHDNKRFTIYNSVWIAAAVYAYNQYSAIDNPDLSDFYLKAPELQKMASEYTTQEVQSARIHQYCNGDHSNANHKYLRRLESSTSMPDFRLTAKGEFGGDGVAPADLDLNETISVDGREVLLSDIMNFVNGEYTELVMESTKNFANMTEENAVWFAAACMTYEACKQNKETFSKESILFSITDIADGASQIMGRQVPEDVVPAKTTADAQGAECNYLVADGEKRRVAFMSEFNQVKEYPEMVEIHSTSKLLLNDNVYDLRSVFSFIKKEYTERVRNNFKAGKRTQIDYLSVLDYMETYALKPYAGPDKIVTTEQRDEMEVLKTNSQAAIEEMKKMVELCKKQFGLDKCMPIKWLDGSSVKIRKYLWAQMRYAGYENRKESISIFVAKNPDTRKARYRFSLEIVNNGADNATMVQYHKHLELPQDTKNDLVYVIGNEENDNVTVIQEDRDTVRQKVNDGTYDKVQICRIIERSEELTNEECENLMLEGVEALIPYYRHVLGIEENVKNDNDFYPTLDEYDPGIDADTYEKLLSENGIIRRTWLDILYYLYKMGGIGTCKQLAMIHGNGAPHYNTNGVNIAKAIQKETGCPMFKRPNGKDAYWPILFYGKGIEGTSDEGIFSYKLREPLVDAIQSMDKKGVFEAMVEKENFDLNMILYGPPGTGKTYNTAIYAVAICDGKRLDELKDYNAVMKRYEELKKQGRIAFTTFHQSYGYEEFIEGIKPVIDGDSENVCYTISLGVFKKFCDEAEKPEVQSAEIELNSNAYIWKVTIQDGSMNAIKKKCFETGKVRIGFNKEASESKAFVNNIEKGDIIVSLKTRSSVDAIGIITSEEAYELKDVDRYALCRDVLWLATDIDEQIRDINAGKILNRPTVCRVPSMKVEDILKVAKKTSPQLMTAEVNVNEKPYVFIIDEINRGNISKIFGELITLIESTKRKGSDEAMQAILPYSGELFGVPQNVYIIGTMNTADRSIALMDTALRRRFQFVEMMPKSDILRSIGADKIRVDGEEIDLVAMLDTMNERIEYLYDREHTIGHAFFTGLKDNASIDKLAAIFKKSVIPLLQEYFYEDYSKIQMVLGDNDKKVDDKYKFIVSSDIKAHNIFRGDATDIDLPDYKYDIVYGNFNNAKSYIKIYTEL